MLGRVASASLTTLISVVVISSSFGQTFEVASVKPSSPASQARPRLQGGPGTGDPVRITASRVTLQRLIRVPQLDGERTHSHDVSGIAAFDINRPVGHPVGHNDGSHTFALARIVDKTGLTGKYDFKLEYAGGVGIGTALSLPDAGDASEPSGGLTFIDAMEKQLGLKLTKGTAPFDVLVIDHAEKTPTEN